MTKSIKIKVGDEVAYSRNFLRSTGMISGPIPFLRGIVTKLDPFGGPGNALAHIEWKDVGPNEFPSKVLASNLVLKNRIHLEAN